MRKQKGAGRIAVIFLGLVILMAVGSIKHHFESSAAQTAEAQRLAAMTPEQRKAEQESKAATEAARQKAVNEAAAMALAARMAIVSLRGSLHDPDSLILEQALVSNDARTVCISYRAKNAFGGYVRGHMSALNGKPSGEDADWNKRCAGKPLIDMTKHVT